MLRRELAIVLRSRITWLAAALSALLVGHGFVLAIDLFTAGSRSALANLLAAREFDPLAGIVRPLLGGLYLSVSLLAPLVAARAIAVEKERRTFGPLLLQTARPGGVVVAKAIAALAGVSLQLVAPLILLLVWLAVGGHLAFSETLVAVGAHALYLALVVALAIAASAWTVTLAQAAVVAILMVAASWAVDASEGFAALAWLGRAVDWSVTTHLYPMERGTLAIGASLWFVALMCGALGIAYVGVRAALPRWSQRSSSRS
jgi:ABC-type transport system involved in multi-copper enzyme maturation permease subunit